MLSSFKKSRATSARSERRFKKRNERKFNKRKALVIFLNEEVELLQKDKKEDSPELKLKVTGFTEKTIDNLLFRFGESKFYSEALKIQNRLLEAM